jgi:hypothetical protein
MGNGQWAIGNGQLTMDALAKAGCSAVVCVSQTTKIKKPIQKINKQ